MDFRPYAVVGKVALQFITTGAEHGEDMIDAVAVALGDDDVGMVHLINLYRGNLLATGIHGVQVTEFGIKNSCLHFVHT